MPGNGVASYGDLLITSLVVLVGVCIAAYVVVKVVGRLMATGRMRGAHLLDVVARLPLEPRRSLYVVEVAGKTLLVGTSEMGLSVLSELDGQEVKARAVPKQSFGELVRSAWIKRRGVGPSGDSNSAHVGASTNAHVGTADDDPAETRDAHVGAMRANHGADVSAETRDAHVGARRAKDVADVSTETRVARVAVDPSAHVGTTDDVSAETREASDRGPSRDKRDETKTVADREDA